jgi:hypothetical protein
MTQKSWLKSQAKSETEDLFSKKTKSCHKQGLAQVFALKSLGK